MSFWVDLAKLQYCTWIASSEGKSLICSVGSGFHRKDAWMRPIQTHFAPEDFTTVGPQCRHSQM